MVSIIACSWYRAVEDLLGARRLIEGRLTALALPNLGKADFKRLSKLATACETAFGRGGKEKAHATSESNHAFHFTIYEAARSPVFIPIVESLWLQSGVYASAAARIHDESRDGPAVHYHWVLIEALERRDEPAAVEALTNDIGFSFNLIRGRLDAGESP